MSHKADGQLPAVTGYRLAKRDNGVWDVHGPRRTVHPPLGSFPMSRSRVGAPTVSHGDLGVRFGDFPTLMQ